MKISVYKSECNNTLDLLNSIKQFLEDMYSVKESNSKKEKTSVKEDKKVSEKPKKVWKELTSTVAYKDEDHYVMKDSQGDSYFVKFSGDNSITEEQLLITLLFRNRNKKDRYELIKKLLI